MKVVALISAFNEADILPPVLEHLAREGVSAYLLDHGSTDDTVRVAEPFLGRGLLGIEPFPGDRFPAARGAFAWADILARKQELADTLDADWFIHHDADEFRESPWDKLTLAAAIDRVDALGYNAIDFELFNFQPAGERFRAGDDPRRVFRYFEPVGPGDKLQVKCWRKQRGPIDLVTTGGHDVTFSGRRVFPLRFILRHYPVRSQEHGERKIFVERRERFVRQELERGWHFQYDDVVPGHSFVRDPATLTEYDGDAARLAVTLHHRGVEAVEAERDEALKLAQRNATLAEQHAARADRHAAAEAELERMAAERGAELQRAARELAEALDTVRRLVGDAAAQRRELDALYASKTWRWTAPARAALARAANGRSTDARHPLMVAFMPDVLATPQLEIQLEHIQKHLDGGGSAVLLRCDGELASCEVNPDHETNMCGECRQRFARGRRWLRGNVTEQPFHAVSGDEQALIDALGRRTWGSLDELASWRLDGVDIGNAAFSSVIWHLRDASPDVTKCEGSIRRNLAAATTVYFSLKSRLEQLQPAVFAVFNGRLAPTRPALRAARMLGVDCDVLEVAGTPERYSVTRNALTNDIQAFKEDIENVFVRDRLDEAGAEGALDWYRQRRAGVATDWPSFTAGQTANLLPTELAPDRMNLVIFRSSEYEFAGLSGWEIPCYATQNEGIRRLAEELRHDPVRVFVRVHPYQRDTDGAELRELAALGREHANLIVIPAASPVSTYALMDAADAVLTYGSTAGIEAAFAGKLSILMGRALYEDLDVCIRPRSHDELVALIRGIAAGRRPDPPAGVRAGLVKYAHHERAGGELLTYVERVGFFTASMRRGDALEAIEGARNAPEFQGPAAQAHSRPTE